MNYEFLILILPVVTMLILTGWIVIRFPRFLKLYQWAKNNKREMVQNIKAGAIAFFILMFGYLPIILATGLFLDWIGGDARCDGLCSDAAKILGVVLFCILPISIFAIAFNYFRQKSRGEASEQ